MGSLMSGWDSPVSDSKSAMLKRNRSLITKEEIEAYWKSKKKTEEDRLKAIHIPSDSSNQLEIPFEEYGRNLMRSSSLPLANTKQSSLDMEVENNGWWTMSNWAFLNEPCCFEA